MGNIYICLLICWTVWVLLNLRSRLSVTGLPYATKYTMLCSVRRRCRSITLMLDAVTLTSMSVTQYSLPLKIYTCTDYINCRTAL